MVWYIHQAHISGEEEDTGFKAYVPYAAILDVRKEVQRTKHMTNKEALSPVNDTLLVQSTQPINALLSIQRKKGIFSQLAEHTNASLAKAASQHWVCEHKHQLAVRRKECS